MLGLPNFLSIIFELFLDIIPYLYPIYGVRNLQETPNFDLNTPIRSVIHPTYYSGLYT